MDNDESYYQDQELYIEKATLAERIALDKHETTTGKFFIQILTPTFPKGSVVDKKMAAPNISKHKGDKLDVSSYRQTNYVYLEIPKYIVLNFEYVYLEEFKKEKVLIPKGTEFLITSLNKSTKYEDIRIIGLWTLYLL